MARIYANENIPLQVVKELRKLGHDVLTSLDAGNANRSTPDQEVLGYAAAGNRVLLTQNRRHFLRLHQQQGIAHSGIVVCTHDPDFAGLAMRVHQAVSAGCELANQLVRVNRPAS